MRKGFLVGLFVVIAVLFQAAGARAEDSRLPEGARRIDPIRIDDRVSSGTAAPQGMTAAAVPIPPMPDVFLYSSLTERGAQVGLAASMTFVPSEPVKAQFFINGKDIASVLSQVKRNGGRLPKGTVVDEKAYHQFIDTQMPFFLPVGQYEIEVRIFPFFKLPLYWAYHFSLRVDPFEFWAEQCTDSPDTATVRYHITAIGVPPKVVRISFLTDQLTSSTEMVNGIAEWRLQRALYDERLAGKSLGTTLQDVDTDAAVTREVFYGGGLVCDGNVCVGYPLPQCGDGKG